MEQTETLFDLVPLLEGPMSPTVLALLDTAQNNGWKHNFTSMVTRWAPGGEDKLGKPWFASWHLHRNDRGKWAWRFASAMAANLQRLNYRDTLLYLEHPEVIYPEPPAETQADKLNQILRGKCGEGNKQD